MGFIICLKNILLPFILLLFHTALLKCFICSRVAVLDSPWCNNSYRGYQALDQGDFY